MKTEAALYLRPALSKAEKRVPAWVMPTTKGLVFTADLAIACFSFIAAFAIRTGHDVLSNTGSTWSNEFRPYAGILVFAVIARALMLLYQRVYSFAGAFSYTRETIRIFKAVTVSSLLIVASAFLFRGGFEFREFSYSRTVFVLDFFIAFVAFTVFHLGIRFIQARIRERGINLLPTLVVGTNDEALQTIRELKDRPDLGYRVVGVVEGNGATADPLFEEEAGAPIAGNVGDLAGLIRDLEIQEVVITDNSIPRERLFEAMMQIGRGRRVEFRFAPSLFSLLPQKTSVEQIGVLPMVTLFREPLSEVQRFVKRLSDIVVSLSAIVVLAPVWLVVVILIKLDSKGPVLFRQERVGMDGRIFLCYKFRTMHYGADDRLHREAYRRNIGGSHRSDDEGAEEQLFGKVISDPRVTALGRRLRRSSLDELPQLVNVLKGDMSVVGPRPPIPYEVAEYQSWHRKRLDMKPGITGLWQVSGRSRLPFEEMVRIDLYYIENWSVWLDLKILLLTLPAIFRGDGAR
ncbi:MAG TPA: sugar transferase [Pyrinomonadaceae bacterium]|nr:sugar transferase [Pyrinomonadaceae bacterium]